MLRRFFPLLLTLSLVATPQMVVAQGIEQLFQQGMAAVAAGNFSEAEDIFRRVIQLEPDEAAVYHNLGIALSEQDKLDEAITNYRKAIKLDPNFEVAYNGLGMALAEQGKLDEAIANFQIALRIKPNYARAYYNLGLALYKQEKLDEATTNFQQAVQIKPNYARAYNGLGNALYDQGKLDAAIANFQQAVQINPDFADAYYNLGMALREQGKLYAAIGNFQQALQINPNFANAYNGLGVALYDQGKLEEAIASFQKALQINHDFLRAYYNLGLVLSKQGKLEEALTSYQTAIQLDPNFANAHNGLGNVLREQGKLEEALTSYQTAIQLDPNFANAHNGLGNVLREQGKLEEAINSYTKTLQLDPNNVYAQNNLREAQRLATLESNPQTIAIDDRENLPSKEEKPLVKVLRSTARVIAEVSDGNYSVGAGWVVKREGNIVWIVTNRHVISGTQTEPPSDKIRVEFFSELPDEKRPTYDATIEHLTAADNWELDLAVLKVTGVPDDIEPLKILLGRFDHNTNVKVIGHPINASSPWISSPGNTVRYNPNKNFFDIAANVATGNSGGPVINDKHQVIGTMVYIRTAQDTYTEPNQSTPYIAEGSEIATGGFGVAYRMEVVLQQLKAWGILN